MHKTYISKNSFAIFVAVMMMCMACSDSESGEKRIDVNGVNILYEVMGEGKPVILVHGNGGSHKDLADVANCLVQAGYKVYAPDSRGQGANEPLPEYHYKDMAEDVYQFASKLGLEKPAFYGWSDGGIIGLELEIMHPGTLSVMAISGANIYPCTVNDQKAPGYDGPVCGDFGNEDWQPDVNEPLVKMMWEEPRMTIDELAKIDIPVLVTAGSGDLIPEDHTKLIAESLPNSELRLMEGEDHGSYILGSDKMGRMLVEFLQKKGY